MSMAEEGLDRMAMQPIIAARQLSKSYRTYQRPADFLKEIIFRRSYGDVFCSPPAGVCLLADAATSSIRRFDLNDDFRELSAVTIGGSGLPPLGLGAY